MGNPQKTQASNIKIYIPLAPSPIRVKERVGSGEGKPKGPLILSVAKVSYIYKDLL